MPNPTGPDTLTDAIFKASMNPAVQAVMNMPADPSGAPGSRQVAASVLGATTPPAPFAIVGWGWGALAYMQDCQTNKLLEYVGIGGTVGKVSTDAADYPPFAPPPPPTPPPVQPVVYVGTQYAAGLFQTWDSVPDGTYVEWSDAANNGAPAGFYQKHQSSEPGPFGPYVTRNYTPVAASGVPGGVPVIQA